MKYQAGTASRNGKRIHVVRVNGTFYLKRGGGRTKCLVQAAEFDSKSDAETTADQMNQK